MRKRINSIFLAMLALFAFQGNVSAQDVIFENSFNSQEVINNWTLDGYLKDTGWAPSFDASKGCMSFVNNNDYISSSIENTYVVSPEMTLGENNIVSINHSSYNGASGSATNEELMGVAVRTVGGNWTELTGITYSPDWKTFVTSGDLQIPAEFNNQNVQIAFRFTGNGNDISAQWFIKDIKVTKAAGGSAEPELLEQTLFSKVGTELCSATFNGFKVEGYDYNDWYAYIFLWDFNDWSGVYNGVKGANMEDSKTNVESYLVTPSIKLYEQNSFELKHFVADYAAGEAEKALSLCIREVIKINEYGEVLETGNWETVEGLTFSDVETVSLVNIDKKYDGKTIQLGFRYTAADKASAGSWYFTSMKVLGMTPEPKDPAISFDVTELTYEVGSKNAFVAPKINNPLGAKVYYSSSDYSIAQVDEQTGKVTISGDKLGVVTITATVPESIEFYESVAEYTINVIDPILVFKATFQNDNGGFVEEATIPVWTFNYGNFTAQAVLTEPTTSYLVSPTIEIPAEGALVSFDHGYQNIANISEHAGLCVREVGGEWKEIAIENWPAEGSNWWDAKNTGDLVVPAEFNGKTVEFAFRFTGDETTFDGDWNTKYVVSNFIVTKYIKRAESGLAFNVSEYKYYTTEKFEAPVLSNPNDLAVQYRSDNMDVATIDMETGEITIKEPGITTIYAESKKNNEFKAGSASYKLEVIDPTIVFAAKFSGKFSDFTTEGADIWTADGYSNTSAYANYNVAVGEKAYLVSPVIKLAESGNHASWQESGTANFYDYSSLAIKLEGGEWQVIAGADRDTIHVTDWLFEVKEFMIPAEYNGKNVQIAFVFTNPDPYINYEGWNISNFKITKDFVKADPALAYDMETVKVKLGEEFTAPVLSNPENVEVTYSSSDETVAKVDAEGVVTIVGKGETTIKAVSAEHPLYLASEASYVLTVINPVDPEISFSETEVLYNAQMGDFIAPEFNNPYNVEVTFSSSDEAVAKVDAATGVVELFGDGVVTITATSVATDEFLAGTASYTITISELTGIEGVTMEDLMNGKVYDLQGNRVQNIVKGAVYIVNGKKVIIK